MDVLNAVVLPAATVGGCVGGAIGGAAGALLYVSGADRHASQVIAGTVGGVSGAVAGGFICGGVGGMTNNLYFNSNPCPV